MSLYRMDVLSIILRKIRVGSISFRIEYETDQMISHDSYQYIYYYYYYYYYYY